MIQRAEDVLRGELDLALAGEYLGDLWYVSGNLLEEITAQRTDVREEAWYAFDAAYHALHETHHTPFGYNLPNDTMTDPDWEDGGGRLDGAAVAMIAFVGVYADTPDATLKRRTFWEWWLTEAIPRAWEAAQM
ncbi:MAG: hypothetical protein HC880_06485 [Bacteroidia bacterium]|nr:hypothetical protein [Bacteroidia bacterium]